MPRRASGVGVIWLVVAVVCFTTGFVAAMLMDSRERRRHRSQVLSWREMDRLNHQ